MIYTVTPNPAIDRLLYLSHPLEKRKTNRADQVAYDIGGKGTHGSYAMTQLSVPNQALGFAGEKNWAELEEILEQRGIPHLFFLVPDQHTRQSIVIIEPDNRGTTMLTEPSLLVSQAEKSQLLNYLQHHLTAKDMLLIAGSLPGHFELEDLEQLLLLAREKGSFVACDLSGEALRRAVSIGVDFIKPNEFELGELLAARVGQPKMTLKDLTQKVTCVVASKGDEGSICYYAGKQYLVKAPIVREVNDTGAGDCFVGAFLASFYEEKNIEKALRTGSACAASKVQHQDSSYFDLTQVEQLLHQVEITVI
mgnify:CR=1 FL=1